MKSNDECSSSSSVAATADQWTVGHQDDRSMPKVRLKDIELWKSFNSHNNEMIVTKNGRRMFPCIKFDVFNLDPSSMYSITMEFVQIQDVRWKYNRQTWIHNGKGDQPVIGYNTVRHPESPNFGQHWTGSPVSFTQIKLTNKQHPNQFMIVLNSLHRYRPRIYIDKIISSSIPPINVLVEDFVEAEFIAVTAYQNDQITRLKIKHNPFAKAFLDLNHRKRKQTSDAINTRYTTMKKLVRVSPMLNNRSSIRPDDKVMTSSDRRICNLDHTAAASSDLYYAHSRDDNKQNVLSSSVDSSRPLHDGNLCNVTLNETKIDDGMQKINVFQQMFVGSAETTAIMYQQPDICGAMATSGFVGPSEQEDSHRFDVDATCRNNETYMINTNNGWFDYNIR
ncbi:T (predicted) [Pycnogonum litorale]